VPGQQCDSGSNKKYLGIHDTALQAAQVRQKVKTALEQRGDLTPAGVSPEHGVDIRGSGDSKPESLSLSTDRHRSKSCSKHMHVTMERGGTFHVQMKIGDKRSTVGACRTGLEAAQVARRALCRTRDETWRTEAETRQIKWY